MLDRLGDRRPKLRLMVRRLASLLDLFVVTIPYSWQLYQWAKHRKIKLIHQNNGFDLGSLFLSWMLRVPLVAYQRGDEWNSPVVRLLARCVRRFVANSVTTRASLRSLGIPSGRISVMYPPVDFDTLRISPAPMVTRETFGVDSASPSFGILGMLLPWKGHGVFLNAAQRVFERIPDARAFIIGAAPHRTKEYEDELLALAKELGIADRVIFTGFRNDVPDMLRLLDVVVHASVNPEPFGRVIAEAMAMKRPVIASSAGGPTEILEDGRTGFLVAPGDDAALADRIVALLLDPGLAERIAEAGYQDARKRFSADVHAQRMQQIYEMVLGKKDRRRRQGAATPSSEPSEAVVKET
jgi:glycosyltransferase involved in cell wall biosynthesis